MFGLIPAEHWDYNISDIYRGLIGALGHRRNQGQLNIEGLGKCIPIRSARSGILVALKALNLPAGARIGAPLYCCPVVFKAIKAAGFRVRFIDVERDTLCMSASDLLAKNAQLDAVIAVHMFGNLCDMRRLKQAAQGKPIVEDCAQSLGSKIDGQMVGAFGDIAVFSFRSGKFLSVGEGGAIFSKHRDIFARLIQLTSALPVPGCIEDCTHVVKTYLRSMLRTKPFWGIVGHRLWSLYNKSTDFLEKSPIVTSQIFRSDITITVDRLSTLDFSIKQQRANADYYSKFANLGSHMLCDERPNVFYNRYLYPIIFPSGDDRDFISAYLYERRISTMQPYKDIAEIAARYYDYTGDCPVAEQIAKRVLTIPSHHALKEIELRRITECLNSGWNENLKCLSR